MWRPHRTMWLPSLEKKRASNGADQRSLVSDMFESQLTTGGCDAFCIVLIQCNHNTYFSCLNQVNNSGVVLTWQYFCYTLIQEVTACMICLLIILWDSLKRFRKLFPGWEQTQTRGKAQEMCPPFGMLSSLLAGSLSGAMLGSEVNDSGAEILTTETLVIDPHQWYIPSKYSWLVESTTTARLRH